MSVLRAPDGLISFQCDECGEELDTDCEDFTEAVLVLRDAWWVYRQNEAGRWVHYCSEGCSLE